VYSYDTGTTGKQLPVGSEIHLESRVATIKDACNRVRKQEVRTNLSAKSTSSAFVGLFVTDFSILEATFTSYLTIR
jgi:hypothetical protein